jgi:hypothetical protein
MSRGVLRTLASECAALADTGKVSLCTPAASAACAPFEVGHQRHHRQAGVGERMAHHLGRIGHLGQQLRGTKEAHLNLAQAAGHSASSQRSLCAVGMVAFTDCRPSRGPTSLIKTRSGS